MVVRRWASFLIIAVGITFLPRPTVAGGDPAVVRSPTPVHRFLDAPNVVLQAVNITLLAADIASTNRALRVPGTREANPLAQSSAALVALKVAAVTGGIGIAYLLHQSGHHKAERVVPVLLSLPSGFAAIHNAGIHR